LPRAHRVHIHLQRRQIPILNEFDWGAILQMPVGSVQKDARVEPVGRHVEAAERDPGLLPIAA